MRITIVFRLSMADKAGGSESESVVFIGIRDKKAGIGWSYADGSAGDFFVPSECSLVQLWRAANYVALSGVSLELAFVCNLFNPDLVSARELYPEILPIPVKVSVYHYQDVVKRRPSATVLEHMLAVLQRDGAVTKTMASDLLRHVCRNTIARTPRVQLALQMFAARQEELAELHVLGDQLKVWGITELVRADPENTQKWITVHPEELDRLALDTPSSDVYWLLQQDQGGQTASSVRIESIGGVRFVLVQAKFSDGNFLIWTHITRPNTAINGWFTLDALNALIVPQRPFKVPDAWIDLDKPDDEL